MDHIDTCVVGAGVVGLAVAKSLARSNGDSVVLEQESRFGEGISSRNSEVIHAGIYYPAGSLKAELCVAGKQMLYEYCEQRSIGHNKIGKLIVATSGSEESELELILAKAQANGVEDIKRVSAQKLAELEPNLSAKSGLLSPSTGIVSSHELMTALLGDYQSAGGTFVPNTRVTSISPGQAKFIVRCDIDGANYEFSCRVLVNSAGLGAQAITGMIDGFDPSLVPPLYLCRGNYFLLQGANPFRHLIYPVPEAGGAGLGVHATIDLGQQVKFGPDVEYVEAENYAVSLTKMAASYAAIRRYYPALADDQLIPGYVGIRPKLQGPNDSPRDFVIQDESLHQVPGLIQLFGIESPGLTSSMAIAETVSARLDHLYR
jgi:L-2-hydroxyglutarate oxidase LhgO